VKCRVSAAARGIDCRDGARSRTALVDDDVVLFAGSWTPRVAGSIVDRGTSPAFPVWMRIAVRWVATGASIAIVCASAVARGDGRGVKAKTAVEKKAVQESVPEASFGPESARHRALADAASFGVAGLLAKVLPTSPAPPQAPDVDYFGHPIPPSLHAMWGDTIHDATGAPGLHLSSVGYGSRHPVGKQAERRVATVGNGDSDLDLDAFDHGRGKLDDAHTAHPPKVPPRRTSDDAIQRVVRENFGRMRICYEGGLRAHPELRGRVVVKFVIDRRGSVALARDADSDLPDADVVACVVRAFDALTFPASDDSAVTVVYPLVFTP